MITLRLLLAHMIGDYTLQTGEIARLKAKGWKGLFLHFAIITIASGVLVAGRFPYWWAWTIVLGIIHLLIDQYRTFRLKNLSAELSLPYLIFDQTIHLSTIIVIARAGAGETPSDAWRLLASKPSADVIWIVLTILAIFLIWTTAVMELAVLRTFHKAFGISPPSSIVPLDRLFGAAERLIGAAILLTPHPIVYPIVFVPRLYWCLCCTPESVPPSVCGTRTLISALMAAGVGLLLLRMGIHLP
ncbi:MAG: DUF3307 domain-containing protein [Chloroflexi bacterium]|nr:DUF3307 domain-containing protein [Chloroflexota bacterium]